MTIHIFLDIDGVAQSSASVLAGTPMAHAHDLSTVQQMNRTQAVQLLLRIQQHMGGRQHWWIASSWCNGNEPIALQEAFERLGFENVSACESGTRLGRIRDALKSIPTEEHATLVVIDDNTVFEGTEFEARWVPIDPCNGFDGTAYYRTLVLLDLAKPERFFW